MKITENEMVFVPPHALAGNLGEYIRALRRKAGITQTELARRAGVTRQGLSQIERGETGVNIRTLDRLFNAMGYKLTVVAEKVPVS